MSANKLARLIKNRVNHTCIVSFLNFIECGVFIDPKGNKNKSQNNTDRTTNTNYNEQNIMKHKKHTSLSAPANFSFVPCNAFQYTAWQLQPSALWQQKVLLPLVHSNLLFRYLWFHFSSKISPYFSI